MIDAVDVGCTDTVHCCSEKMKASSLGGDAGGSVNLMWQFWSDGSGTEGVWSIGEGGHKQVMKQCMADQTCQDHWLDGEQGTLECIPLSYPGQMCSVSQPSSKYKTDNG